ncbi:MAG TPA: LytTR family DNA-binding domain-containing protein, partial [Caulobacteraceae bacterium]|nr:LytTR family DNA-binding domain-containing protein [Caulobacteraceae bacterium]
MSTAALPGLKATPRRWRRPVLLGAALLAVWGAVALAFSAHAYWLSAWRGEPQAWWPAFGYSLAIFFVWACLTPPLAWTAQRIEARVSGRWRRLALYAAGFPLTTAAHVMLFALLFWPLYNDGGRIASPWAMGLRMMAPNLDTNLLFYALVVAGAVAALHWRRRQVPAPAAPSPVPVFLRARSRGVVRSLPLEEIDWIGAAGNYAEAHVNGATHLLDDSLTALAARLPADAFARIHRSALVRLDRVAEVRSLGRGDALVRLRSGAELRLSR